MSKGTWVNGGLLLLSLVQVNKVSMEEVVNVGWASSSSLISHFPTNNEGKRIRAAFMKMPWPALTGLFVCFLRRELGRLVEICDLSGFALLRLASLRFVPSRRGVERHGARREGVTPLWFVVVVVKLSSFFFLSASCDNYERLRSYFPVLHSPKSLFVVRSGLRGTRSRAGGRAEGTNIEQRLRMGMVTSSRRGSRRG